MTNKERAYLSKLSASEKAILYIGKEDLTPEVVSSCDEALAARELIKVSVQKNCFSDPRDLADTLAGRTNSEVVRVIGRKIILYRPAEEPKIILP